LSYRIRSGSGDNLVQHLSDLVVRGNHHAVQLRLVGLAHQAVGLRSGGAVGGILARDAEGGDVVLGDGSNVGHMALVIHSDLIEAAGVGAMGRVAVVAQAGQLALLCVGVVVIRQHLVAVLLDVVGQVNGGVVQQNDLALNLGVDVVMAGARVHHEVQHVVLRGSGLGDGVRLLEVGVAGGGNGGLDSLRHLNVGLEIAVVGQLADLGGDTRLDSGDFRLSHNGKVLQMAEIHQFGFVVSHK